MVFGRRFLGAFTEDLVELELAPGDVQMREATRLWVLARVAGASAMTSTSLLMIAAVLATFIAARHGRPYAGMPRSQRLDVARRICATRLPIASDWVRAIRALAVADVFERRYA